MKAALATLLLVAGPFLAGRQAGLCCAPEEGTIMAAQTFGGCAFEGKLAITQVSPVEAEYGARGAVPETNLYRYGILLFVPPRLWVSAPNLVFNGAVSVRGSLNPHDWQIGILQAISHARWTGRYSQGELACYRLNTEHGLLKDNLDDTSIFFREPSQLTTVSSDVHVATINPPDAPSVNFLTQFSGNPLRHDDASDKPLGLLIGTEGVYRFTAFLAAVNERSRTIITLTRCDWTANFDGRYELEGNIWSPVDPEIISLQITDEGMTYPAISRATPLPVSLSLDPAIKAMEVLTPSGWVTCERCLPSSDRGYQPSSMRWGA